MTNYNFSISNDFPNQAADLASLTQEILESSILIALSYINTIGDQCIFTFKANLTAPEISALNTIVSNHTGVPAFGSSSAQAVYIDLPPAEIQNDDQYFLIGTVQTRDTDDNQVIISYQVPAGKTLYLMSYTISNDGGTRGDIKIGKLPVGEIPDSPGTISSNIFRAFQLYEREKTGEVSLSPNPRKLAVAGETFGITVTPSSRSRTYWTATLDFILR